MSEVRVRIAPSPTGAPHVGTSFIALFNYVFAKQHQGKFILRIEDTDQTRSHPVYEENILQALRWLGLTWDEGPDVGGPYAPYRQSERTEIYQKFAQELLDKKGAYRCFCTPEDLEQMRAERAQKNLSPKYDGRCRHLTQEEIAKKLEAKEPYVIRLKVPEGKCTIQDRLRGQVEYDYQEIDDQVLLKSDGFPTYHLANVVDDHLMKITHVIRGEEWLPSTPKHVLLYNLFGWQQPEFIHMPLLLNPDGSKLSKRKNPTSIFYYRDAGYLPEALLNYLGMMGYSRPNGEEKFTIQEMISDFDISRISLGGSVFDLKKLRWLCGRYMRENHSAEALYKRMESWRMSPSFFTQIMPLMMERMETLSDFMPKCTFFWSNELEYSEELLVPAKKTKEETVNVLQTIMFRVEQEPYWNKTVIESVIRKASEIWKWKIRETTGVLFVAITGKKVAPPLYESMELLGPSLCRYRLVQAVEKLGGISKDRLHEIEKEIAIRSQPQQA